MQKEVLLNSEEVFRLIGRQSWEIERLRAKIEELSQALSAAGRSARSRVSTGSVTPSTKCSSTLEVRGVLLKKGETVADWARRKGYDPTCASRYLLRWGGRNKRPRGRQTREIIEALESETGIKICG